jgi:hypothetical protein
MKINHSFSCHFSIRFLSFAFFLAQAFLVPCISFAETAQKQIPLLNADFSDSKKNWSPFGREKDALAFDVDDMTAHVTYSGKQDWAISNATRIPVSAGQVYRISCIAKSGQDIPSGRLCVVSMKNGDAKDYHMAQTELFSGSDWKTYTRLFVVYEGVDTMYLRLNGNGTSNVFIKDIRLEQADDTMITPSIVRNQAVFENGKFTPQKYTHSASETRDSSEATVLPETSYYHPSRIDTLDRGLTITPVSQTSALLSWRLLDSDPDDISFTVSKKRDGDEHILTKKPVTNATCFLDDNAYTGEVYTVTAQSKEYERSLANNSASITFSSTSSYQSIPLVDKSGAEKLAAADLDGDGKYDFVAKCPAGNIDPGYYTPSKQTYSLQAYTSQGTLLWKKDLGWNIESGTWYSPYVVCDLDGDGKAEVIVKTGDDTANGGKDWRNSDGRVTSGPEYLSVLDGMTGKELARTDWISRDGFEDYNRTSRNQLAIAYLDTPDAQGRQTPCIIMLRGTYGQMKAQALMYVKSQLVPVWSYSNEFLAPNTRGQGAHYTICADIDGDGRDEVILGSLVLDDDGSILWTTGRGHPDGVYYGDINPSHPGNEIAYFYETKQKSGGICLVDALTGKELWGLPYETSHIHSRALCADIDASHPGRELYGQDCINDHVYDGKRWLLASDGTILKDAAQLDHEKNKWGFAPFSVYWNDTPQRTIADYTLIPNGGTIVLTADIVGDWREEIITSTKNELRIYSTPVPSHSRRTCLMQDKEYRSVVMMDSNGYLQNPDTVEPVLEKRR